MEDIIKHFEASAQEAFKNMKRETDANRYSYWQGAYDTYERTVRILKKINKEKRYGNTKSNGKQ